MPAGADNVGVSGSAPLIGRGLALAGLRAALDGALAGHGSLVLIAGEAGIGKTALAARFAGQAAACGVPVAWGSCAEGDGAPAFWPWTQVLRATGGLAEGEDHVGPRTAAPDGGAAGGAADRFAVFDRVTSLLRDSAADRGLVVVLDDLHWADPDSLALLEFAARQLAGQRLLLVGCYRDVEAGDRLRRAAAAAEVTRLGGLEAAHVGELMAQVAAEPVPENAAARMQARTGGNPLFVRELTRLLQARPPGEDRWSGAVTVDSVRGVIDRRLARLSQACIRMLTLAALDGAAVRPWLLAQVLGDDPGLAVLAEEAAAARVLVAEDGGSRLRFAHDLFCEVLAADLPAPARRRGHHDLGAALEAARAEGAVVHPAELAAHFGRPRPPGMPRRASVPSATRGRPAPRRPPGSPSMTPSPTSNAAWHCSTSVGPAPRTGWACCWNWPTRAAWPGVSPAPPPPTATRSPPPASSTTPRPRPAPPSACTASG